MIIYAKQVPPEHQESPLFWDLDALEDVNIYGNRQFREHKTPLFEQLPGALDDLLDAWETQTAGTNCYYSSWVEALADLVPPQGRPEYTREERRDAWPELLQRWDAGRDKNNRVLLAALELITGRPWASCTLRGCCQSDWQYCVFPANEWDGEALEHLETEYFNTGTEWIVHDDESTPGSPDDINGFSVYCHGWNNDQIRREIADAAGGNPDEVQLYQFAGYEKRARYEEV